MGENEFRFHQQDNREIKRLPLDLSFEYKKLLTMYKQNQSQTIEEPVEKEIESIEEEGRKIAQKLYVRPNEPGQIPRVGASQSTNGWELSYEAGFVVGNTKQNGDIIVGHAKLKIRRGLWLELQSYSLLARQVADRYDSAIFQAVSDVYELPVLQSIQTLSKDRRVELIKRGYLPRPGYPEVLDKVFTPLGKN